MKTNLSALVIVVLSVLTISCKKNEFIVSPNEPVSTDMPGRGQIGESGGEACISPYVVKLLIEKSGKNNNYEDHVGDVSLVNEEDSIRITYDCINGNVLKEIRVWAGEYNDAPVNNAGHPKNGQFLIELTSLPNIPSYTVKIAKSVMGDDGVGIIMAHAKVFKHNSESSWGEGPQFVAPNGKARYIAYKPCFTTGDQL